MRKKDTSQNDTFLASSFTKNKIKQSNSANFYKGIALSSLTISITLIISIVFLALKPKTEIPYVIEVNKDGEAKYVNNPVATLTSWTPSQTTVMHILKEYIVNLRSVSSDPSIQNERIKKVYAFSTKDASKKAINYLKETSPMDRLERETVRVDVYAITPLLNGNDKIYQLDWNERTYSLSNILKNEKNYRAIINIGYYRVNTKNFQETNPLGIYVEDIEISEIKDGYVIL